MTKLSRLSASHGSRRPSEKSDRESGFTLLELVVVLLIVTVLLIVGIPTLLSYLAATSDSDAQANLRTALGGANALYNVQFNTYSGLCSDAFPNCNNPPRNGFAGTDTGLNGVDEKTASTNPQTISIWVSSDGSTVVLTALADSTNNCWAIVRSTGNTVVFGKKAPVTFYVLERSKNHKAPGCFAGNPIFRSPIRDVTNASTITWPAVPPT